jgi:hypothetical protein
VYGACRGASRDILSGHEQKRILLAQLSGTRKCKVLLYLSAKPTYRDLADIHAAEWRRAVKTKFCVPHVFKWCEPIATLTRASELAAPAKAIIPLTLLRH